MPITGNGVAGSALTGSKATVDWLGKIVEEIVGGDKPGKGGANVAVVVVKLSDLMAEPTVLVNTAETRGNTLSSLGRAETTEAPPAGVARFTDCKDGNLATTFVLLASNVGFRPVNLPVGTPGLVACIEGTTAGVHAAEGELMAGTLGNLVEDWRRTGAWGATVT